MRKFTAFVMTVVLMIAFTAALTAQAKGECPMGRGMGKGMGMGMEEGMGGGEFMAGPKMVLAMASELNLTTEQMEKIKKISDACPEKGEKREAMEKDRDALEAELSKDKPDTAKIDSMIDKMFLAKADNMKKMIRAKIDTDAVLTKEQKEKLKTMREDRKGRMEKFRNK